jgi:hypothetical protein
MLPSCQRRKNESYGEEIVQGKEGAAGNPTCPKGHVEEDGCLQQEEDLT